MPFLSKKFLDACRGCTYDTINKCLVTTDLSGSANAFLAVLNGDWYLARGGVGMPVMDQASADKIAAADTLWAGNDSFTTGGVTYSLIIDPSEQAKVVAAS